MKHFAEPDPTEKHFHDGSAELQIPRDLQFSGPFVEVFRRRPNLGRSFPGFFPEIDFAFLGVAIDVF